MSRYIDADELIEFFDGYPDHIEFDVEDIKSIINEQDAADVRENVRGRWLPHDLENGEKSIDEDCCSVCGERFREIAMTGCEWNFCPNCGADMRGEYEY